VLRLAPIALLLAACAPSGSAAAIAKGNVFVVDRDPTLEMTVSDTSIIFPAANNQAVLGYQPNDVLVSGMGAGFLRKVVDVQPSGDRIIVHTENGDLTDALEAAEISHSTKSDGKEDWLGQGLEGVYANFGNVSIEATNVSVQVANSSLSFSPDLDVDLKIADGALQKFDLVASGRVDAALDLEVQIAGAGSYSLQKDLYKSTPKIFVQMIGWVPVVEVVQLKVGIGISGAATGAATAHIGATGSASVTTGTRYVDGAWHDVGENMLAFQPIDGLRLDDSSVSIEGYAYVVLDVKFYDLAGPFVGLYPYVGAIYDQNRGGSTYYGIQGVFGGHVVGTNENEIGINYNLFDFACDFGEAIADCAKDPPEHFSPVPRARSRG
jgi:hypothetical protein